MFKKVIKISLVVALILIFILSGNIMVVLATTQADLNDINKKIDDTEKKLDQVEQNLSESMKQIQSLNAEIAEYENRYSNRPNSRGRSRATKGRGGI